MESAARHNPRLAERLDEALDWIEETPVVGINVSEEPAAVRLQDRGW